MRRMYYLKGKKEENNIVKMERMGGKKIIIMYVIVDRGCIENESLYSNKMLLVLVGRTSERVFVFSYLAVQFGI